MGSSEISKAAEARGLVHHLFRGAMLASMLALPAVAVAQSGMPSGVTPGQQSAPATNLPAPQPANEPGASTGLSANPPLDPQQALAQKANTEAKEAASAAANIWHLRGQRVAAIEFTGVQFEPDDPLPSQLPLKVGDTLDPTKLQAATRRLFLTGLYRNIDIRSISGPNGVTLVFEGQPRYFVGRIRIEDVRQDRLVSILEYATQLQPGLPFTRAQVAAGTEGIRQSLAQNGYFAPTIRAATEHLPNGRQVDVIYSIDVGPQATVGNITVSGDPGLSVSQFRKIGKLNKVNTQLGIFHYKNKITRDTTANALSRLRAYYQKKQRLEAAITVEKQEYSAARKQLDYSFLDDQGPLVKVSIEGAKVSSARQKKLLPIYEESAVDNDLLNEGAHNIQEFLIRQGYFDATVDTHVAGVPETPTYAPDGTPIPPSSKLTETVTFAADKGRKYRVAAVNISGNHYFGTNTILERMQVTKATLFMRTGTYSPVLLQNDIDSIKALYNENGFNDVQVTHQEVKSNQDKKIADITVNLHIDEGPQRKFGTVNITGVNPARLKEMQTYITSQTGQPYSLADLSSDRDNILQEYLSLGFDQAKVEVRQVTPKATPNVTNITYLVSEGEQVFVDRLLISGRHNTRKKLIDAQLLLKPGDPLNGSAEVEMQRKFYDLAIFSEVNVATQNPAGQADRKNVLIQLQEAKRWDVTYGAGFESQLSTPQPNCQAQQSLGGTRSACSPNGTAGASFRVSLDVTRLNLFGTDQSLTLHTTYGLLERIATLTLNTPRLFGNPNFASQITGGYSNVQNITTFKASTEQALFRITEKIPRRDTLIYDFEFRQVTVDKNSLQVTANLIPLLSEPVRVGGPGFTWYHDTRNPTPLDAIKGQYISFQEFFANSKFGSQVDFNRVDMSQASYYTWGRRQKYTFARNTRLGFENAFGSNPNVGVVGCTGTLLQLNASCDPVPLPERLYAGGADSHRGFGINEAGPRDLTTGFPVGGTAVFVNSLELRLPPPVLPVVGNSVSFVLFHDMGNVFNHVSDMWPSFIRIRQPNSSTCREVTGFVPVGTCNFNYFSHAVGLGARYHTPVGPIRLDLSYNLNPPIYPIIDDFYDSVPHHQVGQASHFQFFFSIGQAF